MTGFSVLSLTLAAVLASVSAADAAVSPGGITTNKQAARTNAFLDRDRMNDIEWAGVVRSCLTPRGGITAIPDYDPLYCRAVLDVQFDDGDDSNIDERGRNG